MKKHALALAVLALAGFLCACAGEGPPPADSAGTASPPAAGDAAGEAAYTGLDKLIADMAQPGLYWQVELPDMDISTHHVSVTDELRRAAVDILSAHSPTPAPEMRDDDSRDRAGEAVVFQMQESADGIYPSGSQQNFCVLLLLGENDPQAPGMTALFLPNEDYEQDCILLPASVYTELLELFSREITETHADPEGAYVPIIPGDGEGYPISGDVLECGGLLLFSRYAPEDDGWMVEAFDPGTGESVYRIAEGGGERGALLRMAPLRDVPDYDHCLFFDNGFAYRSSADAGREAYFPLPEEVQTVWHGGYGRRETYDQDGDYIAWMGAGGVFLRVAKQDGINTTLVLPDTAAAALIPDPDSYNGALTFASPRFLCAGRKVAAGIYSESQQQEIGVAVYDIAAGEITSTLTFLAPAAARYPILDRYAASAGMINNAQLLDAETGEIADIPFLRISRSYDYETFVVEDYVSVDAWNAPAYVVDIDNPDDRSRPLLRATQPYARMYLVEVTENFAVFLVNDFDGEWYAVARYR